MKKVDKSSATKNRNVKEKKSLQPISESEENYNITDYKLDIEEKQRMSQMLDFAPESITVHDFDGHFLYANKRTFDLHGYSREEFMALNLHQLDVPESENKIAPRMQEIIDHDKATFEVAHYRKDRSTVPLEISCRITTWGDKKAILSVAKDITERKQILEKLKESEKNLIAAQHLAQIGSWKWFVETNTVQWSEELCRINGHDPDLPVPPFSEMSSFYTPESWKQLNEAVTKAFNSGESYELELDLIRTDGAIRKTRAIGAVDYDVSGKIFALHGTVQDITERKQAVEKLIASENQFRQIAEHIKEVFWISEPDWSKIYYISPTYNDVWGEEAEKLYEQPFLWIDSIIDEDKEKVRSCIPETITKDVKEIIFPDYRIKKPDGAIKWISARAFPIFDSEGNPHRIAGIAEDITERKQVEEQLQDSELWMKGIFAALGESVLVVTPDRRLVNTNPAVLHMFGYTHEELSNRSTEILHVDHEHFLEFGRRIQDAFDKGEPAHFEFEAKRKGGEIFPTEHTVSLLKDKSGEVKGIVSVVRDITELKQAEEELLRRNYALSKLNQCAVVLSDLSPADNFEAIITRHVKEISGADVAIFSEYNSKNKTTSTRHIEIESAMLKKVVRLLGTQVKNIHSVVSDEMYRKMTTELIGIRKTLYEVSFGAISKPVGAAIQALLKVDRFIGVAYLIEGELFGTSVLAMSRNRPDPPREILENFINLASISLRRRKSEEKLVQSEESLRKAQKVARMGSWKWDIRNNRLEWSDEMFHIFGIDKEYFSGDLAKVISGSIHPNDRNAVEKSNLAVLKHKKPIPLEYRIVLPNGTERVVCAEGGDLILDNKGNPESLSGIVQDITVRKQAEELLKVSEIKYRKTVESINEAFFTLDNELRFTYFNKQAEVILLKKSSDVLGKQIFSEVFPEAKGSMFEEKYRYALTAKKMSTFETFFGIEPYINWYDVRVYPAMDGISVFFTIITDRKKAEKELQKRINDLEEFHSLVIDREFKMIELKKEINELAKIAGKPERYEIAR